MAPGNAQLHDHFCLSEKATRKTKQRKVIFGFNQRMAQHFWNWTCLLETDHWNNIRCLFKKLQQKIIGFAKTSCFAPWKTPQNPPTFAKQHQQRRLAEIRNPWYRRGISHRPDPTHDPCRPRRKVQQPRRRKLFKGLKRHGVKSTPGTKTWKTP